MGRTSTIYVLHFEPAYSAPIAGTDRQKVVQHYLGSTGHEVERRLAEHLAGQGSPLVRAAVAAGCSVTVGNTWPGGRTAEREAKRRHRHKVYCRLCGGSAPRP